MDTPICDFIKEYEAKGTSRLHMPGHKGVPFLGCENRDITEICGADELYEAAEVDGAGWLQKLLYITIPQVGLWQDDLWDGGLLAVHPYHAVSCAAGEEEPHGTPCDSGGAQCP